jgi:hypothetical protein
MAVCLFFHGPGVTQAQYDAVRNEVAPGDRPPQGATYHVAGPTEDGWCVAEVWESEEALKQYAEGKLKSAMEKQGVSGHLRVFQVVRTMQA